MSKPAKAAERQIDLMISAILGWADETTQRLTDDERLELRDIARPYFHRWARAEGLPLPE